MKSEVADFSYEPTGNELIALLLESDEIKKHKPIYNIAQKKSKLMPIISIYSKLDSDGYKNLYIDRYNEEKEPIVTTDSNQKARDILYQLTEKYNLCLKKMELFRSHGPCFYHQINQCKGACIGSETSDNYNQRFEVMINKHSFSNESFFLIGKGRYETEQGVILIKNGQYQGFGFVDISSSDITLDDLKFCIKKYQHNRDIQNIIISYQKLFRRIDLK
jgi:DNA polymerase III subunit epsilon